MIFLKRNFFFFFSDIREQIQRLQNELKQLYNESQLKQVRKIIFINHQ